MFKVSDNGAKAVVKVWNDKYMLVFDVPKQQVTHKVELVRLINLLVIFYLKSHSLEYRGHPRRTHTRRGMAGQKRGRIRVIWGNRCVHMQMNEWCHENCVLGEEGGGGGVRNLANDMFFFCRLHPTHTGFAKGTKNIIAVLSRNVYESCHVYFRAHCRAGSTV